MYAVIFSAIMDQPDSDYSSTAERMRQLAFDEYGCRGFTSCSEGKQEVAISYWDSEEQILQWRQNTEHLAAQSAGQKRWYKSYSVQVSKIVREYHVDNNTEA